MRTRAPDKIKCYNSKEGKRKRKERGKEKNQFRVARIYLPSWSWLGLYVIPNEKSKQDISIVCLLYTSDAADE